MAAVENWAALGKPHPEFQKLLESADVRPSFNVPIRELRLREDERARRKNNAFGKPDSIVEAIETAPSRDGHKIPIKIYRPIAIPEGGSPLLIHLHGGGFCYGNTARQDVHCWRFVEELGVICVSIGYRLAPENPFPAAPNDTWDAIRWIATNAHAFSASLTRGFVLSGYSSGGNLAAVSCLHHLTIGRTDDALPHPFTGIFLSVPPLMNAVGPPSLRQHLRSRIECQSTTILNQQVIAMLLDAYAPDPDSSLWTIFAEYEKRGPSLFEGWPATVFQICGADPLRDEALMFEKILRESLGVKTKVYTYAGLPHGFDNNFPALAEASQFAQDLVDGVRLLLTSD